MPISEHRKECFGCGACADICPKEAVTMIEDEESFLYPHIDIDKCINCGLCNQTCPINYDDFYPAEEVEVYVGHYKSDDVVLHSSSGGAFTALCEIYINLGYKVYGVEYSDDLRVIHGSAINTEECERFRKSKYVQSYYNNVYKNIANDLKQGLGVVFSGTSCECAALQLYIKQLNINDDLLVTVSILCHGVPSQKLFDSYLNEEKGEVIKYQFRYKNPEVKKERINSREAYLQLQNGNKYIRSIFNDPFLRGYYTRLFYRPSCYQCTFARRDRMTDFTLADAWGIENISKSFNSNIGASLILFNTEKSKRIIQQFRKSMQLEKITSEWAYNSQMIFNKPTAKVNNRDKFFSEWQDLGFRKAVFRNSKLSIKQLIMALLPQDIKQKIRNIVSILH